MPAWLRPQGLVLLRGAQHAVQRQHRDRRPGQPGAQQLPLRRPALADAGQEDQHVAGVPPERRRDGGGQTRTKLAAACERGDLADDCSSFGVLSDVTHLETSVTVEALYR